MPDKTLHYVPFTYAGYRAGLHAPRAAGDSSTYALVGSETALLRRLSRPICA
ncbi:MAG: hypothetical protein RR295_10575 [Oscillospiraceae bacterium]